MPCMQVMSWMWALRSAICIYEYAYICANGVVQGRRLMRMRRAPGWRMPCGWRMPSGWRMPCGVHMRVCAGGLNTKRGIGKPKPLPGAVCAIQTNPARGAYSAPPPAWRGHGRGSCNTCIKRGRGQTKAWPCVHAAAGVPVQFAAVRGVRPPRVLPAQGKTMRPCPNSGRVVGAGAV